MVVVASFSDPTSATLTWRKNADSFAITRSATIAKLIPIPAHGPLTAATTGTRRSRSLEINGLYCVSSALPAGAPGSDENACGGPRAPSPAAALQNTRR